MTRRLVVCPHPPLLLDQFSSVVDPVAELRQAIAGVLTWLGPGPIAVVGVPDGYPSSGSPGGTPMSLQVGAELCRGGDSSSHVLTSSGELSASRQPLVDLFSPQVQAILALGDGSPCRQVEGGPGLFDEQAREFDQQVGQALGAGDPAGLGELDAGLADQLQVGGFPLWSAMSRLPDPVRSHLHYAQAPLGVGYFVASWEW